MKLKVNGWRIDFFNYSPTYLGLLSGEPNEGINDRIIQHQIKFLKRKHRLSNFNLDKINIIKEYSGYYGGGSEIDKNEFALKEIMCVFQISKGEKLANVITFTDELSSPESVVKKVTQKELKTILFDY
jgi:hypothetical protein